MVDLLIDKDTDLTNFFAKDGMLKELTKNLFERALKAEMDEHLGIANMVEQKRKTAEMELAKKS